MTIHRDEVLKSFASAWRESPRPSLVAYLDAYPEQDRETLLRDLVKHDCQCRRQLGEYPTAETYTELLPTWMRVIEDVLSESYAGTVPPPVGGTNVVTHPPPLSSDATLPPAPQLPPVSRPSVNVTIGQTIGPYELLEKIGEGGMGAVFKARHQHLDKIVALKLLPNYYTQQADAVVRFRREMKAVGKIDHPNIVRAMDAGEINGLHYLAMEYIDGRDLSVWLKLKGPFSVLNACKAIRQAAQALAAAHQAGLVHRDIKPSNLLVAKTGQIKLLDLGLALLAEESSRSTEVTLSGQAFGTPDYMAPEQWASAHSVDARTDLYALGCTLFFLLTGHAPYEDRKHVLPVNKMTGHVTEPIPDLLSERNEVPPGVVAIYQKLMAKSPEDRYQSAQELLDAIIPLTSKKLPQEARTTVPVVTTKVAATTLSSVETEEFASSLKLTPATPIPVNQSASRDSSAEISTQIDPRLLADSRNQVHGFGAKLLALIATGIVAFVVSIALIVTYVLKDRQTGTSTVIVVKESAEDPDKKDADEKEADKQDAEKPKDETPAEKN